jgi:hypothetical protein
LELKNSEPSQKRKLFRSSQGIRVINELRTRLITEGSSLTLVTHSLYTNWSHHNYLSENEKEKEKENDRFAPFGWISWSPPKNWKSSHRFTSLGRAAVAAACKWTEAKKKSRERKRSLYVLTKARRKLRGRKSSLYILTKGSKKSRERKSSHREECGWKAEAL